MRSPGYFISCDWGTTNFRLRLVETETLRVIAEYQNDQGVKKLYDQYAAQRSLNQEQFFSNYLQEQIRLLPEDHHQDLIVISGMASSNIALSELEYAEMPFDFHGGSLNWKRMLLPNGLKIVLISGVKGDNGMMRGEETQAIGLAENLGNFESGMVILPGTHSKHLSYENQQFTTLRNNMTGELFDVLSQNSILSNSVVKGSWCESTAQAFLEGLDLGLSGELTANLLYIRFNDVVKHLSKENNYYHLSGMLIGDELSYLKDYNRMIFLGASGPLLRLYQVALENIIDDQQLVIFDKNTMEHALLVGQKKILALHDQ